MHHFFSDHERRLFYLFEWSDVVVDIREQFPILDLDLAMSIATDMGMKYPTVAENDTPDVLTTDFMLSVNQNGKSVQIARTVKMSKDLEKTSVAEKFELERRYYAVKDIDWAIITEKEIPRILADNIEWIHSAYRLEGTNGIDVAQIQSLANALKYRLHESDLTTISQVAAAFDNDMNIEPGTSLYLFKHLVAHKQIIMDMMGTKIFGLSSTRDIEKIIF
ncbi:TnsA endonuclease C-terminal domain-containing protein [Nostoc sp.]|uniref:TnsA endonuclease C-terminal domain-containing protein n=1 Tax=Nostoc sp. TaxID=1180 RepID=UPI002FFB2789